MITKVLKLVTGEEIIANVDDNFETLFNDGKFFVYKARILAIGYDQETRQPYMQLLPYVKGDMNGRQLMLSNGIVSYSYDDLNADLVKSYLQETTGLQLA